MLNFSNKIIIGIFVSLLYSQSFAATLFTMTTSSHDHYGLFSGSLTGDITSGSASQLSFNSAGYYWSGSIGLTNTDDKILGILETPGTDAYTFSTKGFGSPFFGLTCASSGASACVTITPGISQSLKATITLLNSGRGICCDFLGPTDMTLLSASDIFSLLGSSGPSAIDTQSSLTTLSKSLRSSFNATFMSSNYANMNTYDCNLFDKNNMCISAGGRITTIDNPSSHHSAAVVVLGHKISPNLRIGGFLDQSVNHSMPSGVDMSNKNPMAGAFAV